MMDLKVPCSDGVPINNLSMFIQRFVWDTKNNTFTTCFEWVTVSVAHFWLFATVICTVFSLKFKRFEHRSLSLPVKVTVTRLILIGLTICGIILQPILAYFMLNQLEFWYLFITVLQFVSWMPFLFLQLYIYRQLWSVGNARFMAPLLLIGFTWGIFVYDAIQLGEIRNVTKIIRCILVSLVLAQFVCYVVAWYVDTHESRGSPLIDERQQPTIELECDDESANCISRLIFYWVNKLMLKGYHRQLTSIEELYELPKHLHIAEIEDKFHFASMRDSEFSLVRTLHRCFGWEYYALGLLKFIADALIFAGPILLSKLVNYMEDPDEPTSNGYIYAGLLFATTLISAVCSIHFDFKINKMGLRLRSALITAIYNKMTNVPLYELSKFSSGEITNFMSTDTSRIQNYCPSFHAMWSLPMQIIVALILLYREIGISFLAGVGFALMLIPLNRWIAVKIGSLSTEMMLQKDRRVNLMTEILFGIRTVKFSAWEPHFLQRIEILRNLELKSLKGRKYLDAFCVYFWASAPVIMALLTFSTFVLLGNQLTAAKIFTSMALFNILIAPLNSVPWVINGLVEAWISTKRLQRFFMLKNFQLNDYYDQTNNRQSENENLDETEHLIDFQNSSFQWNDQSLCLKKLNLSFPKNKLTGIFGSVGSGKSSVFCAALAEMKKSGGILSWSENGFERGVALVTQDPWLQKGTVRANITFGRPFAKQFYDHVIEACALDSDFQQWPNGDLSNLGDQGITMSGGQRARIALARALYQDRDVYFLDDPLSAVDPQIAKKIFDRCIRGILKNRTVILVTHRIRFLTEVDHLIYMKEGSVVASGLPKEVLQGISEPAAGILPDLVPSLDQNEIAAEKIETGNEREAALIQEEEREIGNVKLHVYSAYISAIGIVLCVLIFVSLILMQISRNVTDWWLSYWVNHANSTADKNSTTISIESDHLRILSQYLHPYSLYVNLRYSNGSFDSSHHSLDSQHSDEIKFYLSIYGSLGAVNSCFTLARAFLFAYGGVVAAKRLHEKLLAKLFKAKCRFFDVTPVGRLVNRFSSDMYAVDDSLPFQANRLIKSLVEILGTLGLICYGLPSLIFLLIPLGFAYYWMQNYYRYTTCELKRLCAVSLSPVFSHFTESLTGLMTIRAFRATERFQHLNRQYLTDNQRALYSVLASTEWLGARLQMLGVATVTAVALVAVFEHQFRDVDPGLVGLVIAYALSVTGLLGGGISSFTETEKEMVSVERIQQYIDEIPEENWDGVLEPPSSWPTEGRLQYRNVSLRYAEDLPLALNDINFSIDAGLKIGICGRTGSGKSTLFQALFRGVELESGEILFDGVNISRVTLRRLRSSMTLITQYPALFSGTIRQNIDVAGTRDDDEIWAVVKQAQLDSLVNRLGGLDGITDERGSNLSAGERQLLCLARAMLSKSKVIAIDEPTANVDQETDAKVQTMIRNSFRYATVLMIAHRIRTVMDCDRVLVLANGRIVEEGPPNALIDRGQYFAALVREGL